MEKKNSWKNSKYFKLVKTLLIFAALLAVVGMYKSVELQNRAIVLGIGLDYQDGAYEITAEVISPSAAKSGGGAAGSSSSKLVTGKGATAAAALQDIYRTTGKMPSLGQTSVLVLGESMDSVDVKEPLSLFQFADAFRDGVPVASCKGTAKELFQSVAPVDSMVSSALHRIIISSAKSTGTPSNSICSFFENQTNEAKASFVCRIEADDTGAESKGQDEEQGKAEKLFNCTKLDVFREGKRIATVGSAETKGLILLKQKDDCSFFVVESGGTDFEEKVTAKINSKKVNSKFSLKNGVPSANFEIAVKVKRASAGSDGFVMDFLPVNHGGLKEEVLSATEKQISDTVLKGVLKSVELDCDYFGFYKQFYAALGKKWSDYAEANPDYLSKIQFGLSVKVTEG